jgi:hypothetical protein
VTQPLPPLFTDDIARQSLAAQGFAAVQAAIADLSRKVDALMSEDATVAAQVSQISADEQLTLAAIRSLQNLVGTLQGEVTTGNLTPATRDALAQAESAMAALRTEAQADVTTDTPPSAAPSGA